jgi:membrane protein
MLAYNLILAIVPLGLLTLFVAGQILQSADVEQSVLDDLQRLFPDAAKSTLTSLLHGIEDYSTKLGIAALVASIWICSSFWGALDTAFCQIYHVQCRSWVQQKRFAVVMVGVVLLFMAATVALPAIQSILVSSAENLPFGLEHLSPLVYAVSLAVGLVVLFAILCIIYWAVPSSSVPWSAVWPGAALATIAITAVDYVFPLYLNNVSTIAQFGTTMIFIVIVLFWFYVLAMALLAGGVLNAMRFELSETGDLAIRQ